MEISLARPLPQGAGTVSQWFGQNPSWYAKFGASGHTGLDYAVKTGTFVLAAASGVVARIGHDPGGYGHYIILDHGTYQTRYAHLDKVLVVINQQVGSREKIAISGNSGNSTGPHLHFELQVKGMRNQAYLNRIDPVPFRDI